MIKFFHQAFFLWRTPWGRQWIIIWHANIQSKEKKNSISFKQTHISQKGAIYSNVYLYLWKNREKETKRTKMKTNNFSIHICKILSQQTGSLEKQISTKPNAWPSLPVCLFVCLFVLSLVNFYLVILASFPLLDYCWNGGWDGLHQPMATAKDCTLKSPSFWIYIHTREMRVYMCSSCFWFTLTAWACCLPSCIQVFEFDLDFHCFCSRDSCTGMSILLSDWFLSSSFSLHIDWGRSHQNSSATLLCVCHLHSTALLHAKRCSHSQSHSLNVLFHTSLTIHYWMYHLNTNPE